MALKWEFRFYISPRGRDDVMDWYEDQSARVRAKFISRLRTLGSLPKGEWKRPIFGVLYEECEGLWEIIFGGDIPHRPLGFFLNDSVFVIVICASKNGRRWIPKGACSTGLARKAEVVSDVTRCRKCPLPLE